MYRSPRGSFGKEADAVSAVTAYAAQAAHFILPVIALIVLIRCIASMFYGRAEPETWGHLVTPDGKVYPLLHWECLIGRARSADITLPYADVANVHAVLMRNDAGEWTVSDLSRSGGVYLNGEQITEPTQVFSGDILRCSTHMLKFADMSEERRAVQEQRRTIAGRKVSAGGTLFFLTVFQLLLALEFVSSADSAHLLGILMSFAALVLTQWFCYVLMRTMDRSGFEVETIAFFLCTLGLEICATSTPDDLTKEIILIIVGIALFFLLGWWLRDLSHVKALRWPAAIISLALLALNLFAASEVFGAKNWLTIAGFSLQPSELIKVAFIYVGATSLNRMFRSKSILLFIAFSAICVGGLALMGDFGSALIFFATFLVIAFMRSGSIATVLLAVTSAAMAGTLVLSIKPHVAQRFATWGHVWEDVSRRGLPADARAERGRLRRPVRSGRGLRLAEKHLRRQHRYGVRHAVRGARPDRGAVRDAGHHRACHLHRQERGPGPLVVLRHRRLRHRDAHARADVAQRVRRARHSAVHGRDVPVCVQGRVEHALVLDAAGLHQGGRHPARRELRGAAAIAQ